MKNIFKTPEETIENKKAIAKKHKEGGIVMAAFGGAAAVGGGAAAGGVAVVLAAPVAIPVILTGALIAGLGFLIGGGVLYKKGKMLFKESEIREKLNKIISEALNLHNNKEYEKFIKKLREPYHKKECLLQIMGHGFDINTNNMIEVLIKHGFRPDDIGCLLNLIGEAIASGSVTIDDMNPARVSRDLYLLPINVYYEVISSRELTSNAQLLDNRITKLRQESLKSLYYKTKDTLFFKNYTVIAKEFVKAAQKMSFKSRLDEIRNIARLNILIIKIVNGDEFNFDEAKNLIHEVRYSIKKNHQNTSKLNLRLDVLEDVFWIMTGQSLIDENYLCYNTSPRNIEEPIPSTNTSEASDVNLIKYYMDAISKSKLYFEKIELNKKIASFYEKKAKESKSNKIKSLYFWKESKKAYQAAFKLDINDKEAGIGYARCLLQLCEFRNLILFLDQNQNLNSATEY